VLGLGGKQMGREHSMETARVLNEIVPDYIRVRTLTINNRMPLYDEFKQGNFLRATDEETIEEEKLLIENLECHSNFVSDHIYNLLQEVEGRLPEDKEKMLAVIDRFLALPPEERVNFRIGRRARIYTGLDELDDVRKHAVVAQIINELGRDDGDLDDNYQLMSRLLGDSFVAL